MEHGTRGRDSQTGPILLDGTQRYSLGLWALPAGIPFDRVNFSRWLQEYLQAAGSRGRLTVEVRKLVGASPQQSVVGRLADLDDQAMRDEVVHWNGCENTVRPNEVFDAEEVGDLFVAYYASGAVPSAYVERPIAV